MQGNSFRIGSVLKELRVPTLLLTLSLGGLCANLNSPLAAATAPDATPVAQALPAAIYQQPQPATAVAPAVLGTASPAVSTKVLPAAFAQGADGLSPKVLRAALDAVSGARARGVSGRDDLLTVIDYSLPSVQPRLWVLDLAHGKVLYHELVAHGAGSGDLYATHFSNVNDSRQTSLGLFLTQGTYEGGNGYSLRVKGLDPGVNDRAEERNIVVHGAWYVSADHARQYGRIGRSWGCPALPLEEAKPVIDTIKGGTFIYSYAGPATAQPTVLQAANTPRSRTRHGSTLRAAASAAARLGAAAVLPVKPKK